MDAARLSTELQRVHATTAADARLPGAAERRAQDGMAWLSRGVDFAETVESKKPERSDQILLPRMLDTEPVSGSQVDHALQCSSTNDSGGTDLERTYQLVEDFLREIFGMGPANGMVGASFPWFRVDHACRPGSGRCRQRERQ